MDNFTGFQSAIQAAGLIPPDDIIPGKLHRFPGADKKNGDTSGWCKLFDDCRGGVFGDWSTGLEGKWHDRRNGTDAMSEEDYKDFKRRVAESQRERHKEEIRRHKDAQAKARAVWNAATPAQDDHAYLAAKGVKSHGLRASEDGYLIVPMRDTDGTLHSLQIIAPDGEKRFLPGGRVKGTYSSIGKPDGVLCIAEGYATGASIHQATGHAVAIAFNAGNLMQVAQALRGKFPDTKLVLCADDDWRAGVNPGLAKATEAANTVGGSVALPDFGDRRGEKDTDFNDLQRLYAMDGTGADAINLAVNSAINSLHAAHEPERASGAARRGGSPAMNLPIIPEVGEAITSADLLSIVRRIAVVIQQVDDIDELNERRARAAAWETYLRGKDMQKPMLGTQRLIEARIGVLLGEVVQGPPSLTSVTTEVKVKSQVPRMDRSDFRILAKGFEFLEGEAWCKSRRALVAHIREYLGMDHPIPEGGECGIFQADIETCTTIPEGSIDVIITDPPYPHEYLHLFDTLSLRASQWLKPGGLLVCMSGQTHVQDVMARLSQHMTYRWLCAYLTPGSSYTSHPAKIGSLWKPVLLYSNGEHGGFVGSDVFKSDASDKVHHEWGQSVSGLESLVERLSKPGDTVLDPFLGGGSTAVASLKLKRNFIGFDVDEANVNIVKDRIARCKRNDQT